ncbi:MAG: hypothetical protein NCW75_03095 [Phycisphaera sp.]|nr:MAG: hypothetical protein NCW75_03095 [Phycisphaera sp.]
MQAKQLILVSGMALAMIATTATAQSRNNDNRRDGVQQDGRDRLGEASRAARQEGQRSTANNILTSLEGIWNVNIQVNRTQWDAMTRSRLGTTDSDRTGLNRDRLDSTNPDQGTDRNPRERDIEREGTEIDRQDGTREQDRRDRENIQERGERGSERGSGQMSSADGMARSNAILGGNILQTKSIFGADGATTRSTTGRTPDRQDRDAGNNPQRDADRQAQERDGMGQMDNSNLQSMSFLGYDQNSDEYNLALMTGQSGTIHNFTGKFDRSDRRIVFKSVDSSPVSTSTTDRRSTDRSGTTTSGTQMKDMTMVLRMDGNDTYTVTAYSGSTTTTGTTDRGTDLGGQPSRGDDRGTNNQDRDRGVGDRQGQDATGSSLPANIIYKATYTKADRNMRSQHDRMFDDREREERTARLDKSEQERNERTPR